MDIPDNLPWFINQQFSDETIIGAKDSNGELFEIATVYDSLELGDKDAEYIVHACNLFPELIEALETIIEASHSKRYQHYSSAIYNAEELLSRIKK